MKVTEPRKGSKFDLFAIDPRIVMGGVLTTTVAVVAGIAILIFSADQNLNAQAITDRNVKLNEMIDQSGYLASCLERLRIKPFDNFYSQSDPLSMKRKFPNDDERKRMESCMQLEKNNQKLYQEEFWKHLSEEQCERALDVVEKKLKRTQRNYFLKELIRYCKDEEIKQVAQALIEE